MPYFINRLIIIGLFTAISLVRFQLPAMDNEMGIPRILNYTTEDYNGGTQTWQIAQYGGYVFFGNNDGLLVFDGNTFSIYPLPNGTIVRSVKVIADKIYVGGQNEFGYYFFLPNGRLSYISLADKLPEKARLRVTDVWGIHHIDEQIIFQSGHQLISFQGDEIEKIIEVDPMIVKSASHNNQLYWYTAEQELYEWQAAVPVRLAQFMGSMQLTPTHIYPLSSDSLILATLDNGFYLFHNRELTPYFSHLSAITNNTIYHAQMAYDNWYIATTRNGIYKVSKSGKIQQHYTSSDGLQNNTVLSLYIDSFENIWAGLDRGIDFIPTSSPFEVLYPDDPLRGTGYGALAYDNQHYFATNNGLYVMQNGQTNIIPGTEGQVWRIQQVDGHLYMSHHKGLFQIKDNEAVLLSPTTGSWILRAIPHSNWVIEGTYDGMNLYHSMPEGLVFKRRINNFEESSRYISIEDNRLWVAHPYKGLFGLTLDSTYQVIDKQIYNGKDGLGVDLDILTFQLNNEIVFTGKEGIYQYAAAADSFIIHPDFSPYFDATSRIKLMREDDQGNIWFVEGEKVGYLAVKESSLRKTIEKHVLPALPKALTKNFEFILPNGNDIIIAVEEGFIVINRQRIHQLQTQQPSLRLNTITGSGRSDTTLQLGFGFQEKQVRIPADFPSIEVEFALDNPALSGVVQFQYRLLGYDDNWSGWNTQQSLRFSYLKPGNYTLEVRCKMMDNTSAAVQLPLSIVSPWYKQPIAIILFLALFGLLLLIIALVPSFRFRSVKKKLEYTKEIEINAKEKQFQSKFAETQVKIDQLKSEKMKADLDHQAKELASTTMHLVQKGEILTKIKDNLSEVYKIVADPKAKRQINSMIRTIEADVNFDETWKNFEHNFDKVHVNFNKRLKQKYPVLTPNDIKLCTYLKLNLSSKEIASLTNISVRGVEISRYRLRKKLALDSNENLVEFIQAI